MSGIRWLLAVLRRLILGNCLARASIRGLLLLFSALSRATKKKPAGDPHDDHGGGDLCPVLLSETVERVGLISASFMPTSPHPRRRSTSSFSRSSVDLASTDLTAHPITQESYLLHSLSVQDLPATSFVQQPPAATLSVQHLPALPPSPNLGLGGYLPSTNSSVVGLHLAGPATESSRRSSVYGDIAVPSPPCLNDVHPRIFPATPENVQRYTRKTTMYASLLSSILRII
jgi:hypothetical protein